MSMLLSCLSRSLVLLLALAFLPAPASARSAGVEASCVGAKLRATATQCQSVLQAWGRLERDGQSGQRFACALDLSRELGAGSRFDGRGLVRDSVALGLAGGAERF